jgi:hypothetical protein
MKTLTQEQLAALAHTIRATREQEINCADCERLAAEFAEHQLAGLPLDAALTRVEQHLEVCPECREELLALKIILEAEKRG